MNTGEILIYQNQEGNIKIDVRLEEETVWLTQAQIALLFWQRENYHNGTHPKCFYWRGIRTKSKLSEIPTSSKRRYKRSWTGSRTLQPRCNYFRRLQGKIPARHPIPYLGDTTFERIHCEGFCLEWWPFQIGEFDKLFQRIATTYSGDSIVGTLFLSKN